MIAVNLVVGLCSVTSSEESNTYTDMVLDQFEDMTTPSVLRHNMTSIRKLRASSVE